MERFTLLSRDMKQKFRVPEWFMQAFSYVNLGENKFAFLQKTDIGQGRQTSGHFKQEFYYESHLEIDFKSYFIKYADTPPIIQELQYYNKNPTYCNYASEVYAHFYGRPDVSILLKSDGVNKTVPLLASMIDVHEITLPPFRVKKLVFATYINQQGAGHIAPVIGNADGKIWVANIGAFKRHGIVDLKYAFCTDFMNIKFYEVE